jgi:putative cell wall-binding protein
MLRTRTVLTFSMCVLLVGGLIAATGIVTITDSVRAATVERWDGADRYATSVRISQETFPKGAEVVFLATGQSFPDALAAGPAAAVLGAPILLTATNQLPAVVSAELQRLVPSVVYVLGGSAAISTSVEAQVDSVTDATITRIAGDNRYATAAAVAELAFPTADAVYVAVGTGFADALSAGAPGGILQRPVILTGSTSLPAASSAQITRLANPDVIVLGGTTVVSNTVMTELDSLTTGTVRRVNGANRYGTSVAVSADSFTTAETVFLATGAAFPDALSAAPAATKFGGPILLTTPACAPPEVIAEVARLGAVTVIALGGTSAVSNAAANLTPCSSGPEPTIPPPPNPGDTKNCSDFATYAEAKAWFDTYFPFYGDVANLDADGDGIPCESLPGAP